MGDNPTRDHQQKLARAQRTLLSNLWHPQKHRICLRRSKYMVVRMASRALHWSTVKEDKDSSVVWLDRWESGDLMNLAPPRKVSCWEWNILFYHLLSASTYKVPHS